MTTPAASPRKRKPKASLPKLIEKYYADLGDLAHQNETGKIVKSLPAAFATASTR